MGAIDRLLLVQVAIRLVHRHPDDERGGLHEGN